MDPTQFAALSSITNENSPQRTMAEYAQMYAREKLRILPLQFLRSPGACSCGTADCRSIAKHPATWNGVKDASYDPKVIAQWWKRYPNANIGIATGKGLLVIDIDPKNGGSLEVLNALVDLPLTATVRTGGGGLHLYFSYDPSIPIRNSVSKLAPGIDIRGDNGYVVAPPSIHASSNRYRWSLRCGYTPAPLALLDLVVEKAAPLLIYKDTPDPVSPTSGSSDSPATAPMLVSPVVPSDTRFISEGKRNATLVSMAGSLRNQGANEEAMFLVLQALNKGCCQPPISETEVRQICKSAIKWEAGRGPAEETMVVRNVAALMAEDLPNPPWSIPGLLPEGVSLLAGKPKMGKSWLALSLAISVAQGYTALGKLSTNQGTVLYLGLEDNEQRIRSRMTSLLQDDPPPQALFWAGTCDPLTMGGLEALENWIKITTDPRLIIIDTLARVRAHTGNSSGNVYADDYAAITPLKQMADHYHLSILLIHHLRKNGASDPMDEVSGSTGLTGATDCNMVLQRERGQNYANLHITGRDVEDQTLNLLFDGETGLWSLTKAPSPTRELSPIRESILALLAQNELPMSPLEIAEALDLEPNAMRQRLAQMKKAGQILSAGHGSYKIAPDEETIL